MGKRLPSRRSSPSIRRLRDMQPSAQVMAELRSALATSRIWSSRPRRRSRQTRSTLICAADLEAAFERFLVEPLKSDKLCRAKIAIVQGLDKLEHERPDLFLAPPPTSSSSLSGAGMRTRPPPARRRNPRSGADRLPRSAYPCLSIR